MKRLLLPAVIALFGCSSNEASMVEIVGVPWVNLQLCMFEAKEGETAYQGVGWFDPIFADSYVLPVILRNNLNAASDGGVSLSSGGSQGADGQAAAGGTQITPDANGALVTGYEVCVFRADDTTLALTADDDGALMVDCEGGDVSDDQHFVVAASGGVDPGNIGIAVGRVLTRSHLRALFGSGFDPDAIPPTGAYRASDGQVYFSAVPQDPCQGTGCAGTRDVAWGTFPNEREASVIVQLRANVRLQSGDLIKSGWYAFPVTVCVGCLYSMCPPPVLTLCSNACAADPGASGDACPLPATGVDGKTCVLNNGTTVGCESTCGGGNLSCDPYAFDGYWASDMGACYAEQGFSLPTCVWVYGCPQ